LQFTHPTSGKRIELKSNLPPELQLFTNHAKPKPSDPRQFDLIAFDWDGTLFDSTAIITRCIQRAVVDVGGKEPTVEAASYVIGMALKQALAHAAPDVPVEKYKALGERYLPSLHGPSK
jgi:hypothetical protein